jgi:hypothetical protein
MENCDISLVCAAALVALSSCHQTQTVAIITDLLPFLINARGLSLVTKRNESTQLDPSRSLSHTYTAHT